MGGFLQALAHFFGLDNGSGAQYLFWSGIGSDLGELAIIGGLVQIWRHHNCHVAGCYRVGRHQAGPYVVCRKHHPDMNGAKITHQDVIDAAKHLERHV